MDVTNSAPIIILVMLAGLANAQEDTTCYGPGSIAASVILTFVCTLLLAGAAYFVVKKYKAKKAEHLILESDPEKGAKSDFAFDNPGFKDTSIIAVEKGSNKEEVSKPKWNQWSPLAALNVKTEKKRTVDDSAIEPGEIKTIALRSQDFTGLGFTVCGSMRDGIFVRDVLHHGPAFESGRLSPGDRITGIAISFEHIVLEDALTILSYASPYDVAVEVRSGRPASAVQGQKGGRPAHPVYRSCSFVELNQGKTAKKKLFPVEDQANSTSSNYSSLQKSRSNMTTLERKESKSPRPNQPRTKKSHINPEQLKTQLEQKIMAESPPKKIESETQKSENKYQKFGVKVFPVEQQQQKSPKIVEQNENNLNIETQLQTIDEPDEVKRPQAKKREKKVEPFERDGSLIKRDENGIPQEIPSYMLNAAVAARKNRICIEEDDSKTPKKPKGKAPSPPKEEQTENPPIKTSEIKDYNSDSDVEADNQSSVNTIELNTSDITIHQSEVEERQNRKTASTGDLSKIQKPRKTSSGTLERAQSLDITDAGMPSLKRSKEELELDDLFANNSILNKEPRLSLILDGLNTFQRNKLQKSTEWGNLEDAIFKDEEIDGKEREFDALIDKVNEIKRESQEITIPAEVIEKYTSESKEKTEKLIKNEIWPSEIQEEIVSSKIVKPARKHDLENKKNDPKSSKNNLKIEEFPPVQLRNKHDLKPPKNDLEIPTPQLRTTIDLDGGSPPKINLETDEPSTQLSSPFLEIEPQLKHNLETPTAQLRTKHSLLERDLKPANLETSVQLRKTPHNNFEIIETEHYSRRQQLPQGSDSFPPPNDIEEDIQIMKEEPPITFERRQQIPSEIEQNTLSNFNNMQTINLNGKPQIIKDDIIKDEWEISITNTSPPASLEVVENLENTSKNVSILNANAPDEKKEQLHHEVLDLTQNFLYTEQLNYNDDDYFKNTYDINASDDIKVSRNTLEGLDKNIEPKSDDAKTDSLKHVSNINVSTGNGDSNLHSLEFSVNEPSELYTTALDEMVSGKDIINDSSKVTITTPDIIKNVTLTEAITTLNKEPEVAETSDGFNKSDDSNNKSLTYITEIQVLTPNNNSNVSEIEIIPKEEGNESNLESAFEDYVKNFEAKLDSFEKIEELIKDEPTSIILNDKAEVEKEVHKIHEIAEEQLKKLPEMRFTTSSYESNVKPPEKRHSFEQLRSNFEKSPPKKEASKSRIPIATTAKTPPMSPERRDSRNLENENDRAILELMSSSIHSTPFTSKIKPPSKNITVTSIRNSKIPSGLPTLNAGKPPLPPRKTESVDGNVQVSTNGNVQSSFKQWVFNPGNVTNVVVENSKDKVM